MGHQQRTHEEAYQKATKKTNKAVFAQAMAQLLGGKKWQWGLKIILLIIPLT